MSIYYDDQISDYVDAANQYNVRALTPEINLAGLYLRWLLKDHADQEAWKLLIASDVYSHSLMLYSHYIWEVAQSGETYYEYEQSWFDAARKTLDLLGRCVGTVECYA